MAQSSGLDMALALSRFGLGAGTDGIAAGDAREGLIAEITSGAPPLQGSGLKATPDLLLDLDAYQQEVKAMRAANLPPPAPPADGTSSRMMQNPSDQMGAMNAASPAPPPGKAKPDYNPVRDTALDEIDARYNGSVKQAAIGFNERTVMFWMNHFAVSLRKNQLCGITTGAYEREAIRPHVFGTFYDLVLATEAHPCMLEYLDNQQSIGPNSPANRNGKRGLNENLAREIMELHTLGVGSGYTQTDVTAFAKVITGWSFNRQPQRGPVGQFVFLRQAHEPGPQTIMGKTYAQDGVDQGQAVLRDLCLHPATARHIATKVARHFVADDPPPALVKRLARRFQDTGGDLAEVSKALIEAPESWTPQLAKVRSPNEYLIALIRSTGIALKPQAISAALTNMGQPLWQPSGPNGYPDTVAAWASPEGLSARMEVVNMLARRGDSSLDPRAFAESHLGALLSDHTRDAIARAETHSQGLSLFFLSPEFMRR
ncbi:MAG: DUF1800 domain-containing protein [Asticcacaulis sp.]